MVGNTAQQDSYTPTICTDDKSTIQKKFRLKKPIFFLSLFYLGIFGTAIAFVLYFHLLKTTSAVLMSLITFVTPPLALFWGWFVLDEAISWQLVTGMLIIFSGIGIVRRS